MPPAPFPRRALIEELEPRLLFSADFAPGMADALSPQSEQRLIGANGEFTGTTDSQQQAQHARLEVVFIDLRVQDYAKILADIQAQNADGHSIEVVLIDPARDGIAQIGALLGQRQNVDAVHLISHGSAGVVQLGTGELNFDSLLANASTIKQWGNALTADADILIYGCDVASTEAGQSLIQALGRLTGADVAASDDKTGASGLGGDWTLEYVSGNIETSVAVSTQIQQTWAGTLAIVQDSTSAAGTGASTAAASLSWSHTVNSGSDRILLVSVAIRTDSSTPVSSVSYGGQALTFLSADGSNKTRSELWYLKAPATGTANIDVVMASSVNFTAGAVSFFGVDQTTPYGTVMTGNGSGNPSLTVGSAAGELVVDAVADRDVDSQSVGAGQSALWVLKNGTGSGDAWGGMSSEAGASSVVMNWTTNGAGAGEWAAVAVSLKPTVNSAPVITSNGGSATASINVVENSTAVTTVTATDADLPTQTLTYSISGGTDATKFAINSSTGALSFVAAPNYEAPTDGGANNVYDVIVQVSDGTLTDTQAIAVTVTNVNEAPVVTTTGTTLAYTENMAATAIDSALLLTDVDSANLVSATVTISANYANGQDVLAFTDQNGITGSWNAGTGVLTLTGSSSVANYQTALRSVTYVNTSDAPSVATRTVAFVVNDGAANSNTATRDLSVAAVNDAPVLDNTGTMTLPTITKLQTNNGGATVASVIASAGGDRITDADSGAVEGIAITTLVNGNGSWEYSTNGGASFVAIGAVSNASALLLGASDLVRFVPNGISGTTASFDFRAWDQTSGTAGTKVNVSSNGGTTAFSSASETASITVIDVNVAPVLDNSKSPALAASNEDSGAPVGAVGTLVSALVDFASPSGQVDNVTDVDSGAGLGIAITAANTGNGSWHYSTDNGANWNALGAVSDANARLLAADANTRLYFQPNANYNGTIANAITFRAWDQTSGSNGGTVNLSTTSATVRDQFDAVSYTGNNGTANWTSNWTETADNGLAASGDLRIESGVLHLDDYGSTGAGGGSVQRALSLSGASTATLAFDYAGYGSGGLDTVAFEISSNGGASWTVLESMDVIGTLTGSKTYTLESYTGLTADMAVRFRVVQGFGVSPQYFSVDNVQVSYSTPATGGNTAFSSATDTASLTVNPVNDAPVITTVAPEVTFVEGGSPQVIDALGTVSDVDSANFDGGILTVSITLNASANDRLQVGNFGTGPGQVGVSGFDVTYGGTIIGSVSGGTSGSDPLVIAFNTNASLAAVEEVRASIQFLNVSDAPATATREIRFALTDGDGGTATPQSKLVHVVAVNDAPSGTNGAISATEDVDYVFSLADFGFTDIDANSLDRVWFTTLPGQGTLKWSGAAFAAGNFVSASDITLGLLTYTPPANASGAALSSFTFQVQDNGGTANGGIDLDPTPNTITINVSPVNDAPTDLSLSANTVAENAANGTVVGTATGTDPDSGDTRAYSLTNNAGGRFAINGSTGVLTVADGSLLNYEAATSHNVIVRVTDSGGLTYDETFTINVTNVNEAPTGTDATITINEDTAHTFTTANFGFGDVDAGDSLSAVRIDALPGSGSLTLNGSGVTAGQVIAVADITAGNLVFTPVANANGTGYASLTFSVRDSNSAFDAVPNTLTFNVAAVNDAPVVSTTPGSLNYNENAAATPVDPTLTVVDIDNANLTGATVRISVAYTSGEDVLAFTNQLGITGSWDSGSGTLTLTGTASAANYQTALRSITYQNTSENPGTAVRAVEFVVTDGALASAAATRQVQVVSINDAPTTSPVTLAPIAEDSGARVITQAELLASAADIDGPALSATGLMIATGNGSLVDNGNGTWTYTPALNDDSAVSFSYTVTDGSLTASGSATLDITPVNDAPVLSAIGNQSINEGATLTFTASTSDVDVPANTLTYSLSGAPAGASIHATTGVFSWTPTEAQGAGIYSFDVIVSDGNLTDSETITVTINEVNAAPSGADQTVTTLEDTAYTFTVADFGFADPGDTPANSLLAVRISTLPAAGSLTLNGVAVTAGQTISVANINAGLLRFTPAPDANGAGYASFTFQVQDDGGTANGGVDLDPSPNAITIDVTPVNDAPTATSLSAVETYTEDTPLNLTDIIVGDIDSANVTVTLTLSAPAAGSLNTATSGAVTSTYNAGSGVWSASGALADVNALLAGLTFTPSANYNASFTIATSVSDGVAAPLTGTKVVTGVAVNDAPVLAAIGNQTVTEGNLLTFTASASDADLPANVLTYSLSGAPAGAVIDAVTGVFSWTPTEGQGPGVYSFDVVVSDSAGGLDSEAITVTVNEQNQAPVLGVIGNQIVNEGSLLSFTATATDIDLPANTLTFSLSGAPAGAVIDANTGVFNWTPTEGQGAGVYSFDVVVSDGSLTDSETLTITVNEVNQAPAISSDGGGASAVVGVPENGAYVTTVAATDADLPANSLTYSIVGGADAGSFQIDANTGVLSFMTAPDYESPTDANLDNLYDVVVQVSDGSATDTQAITAAVIDGPDLASSAASAIWRNSGDNTPNVSPWNGLNFGAASNLANIGQWRIIDGAEAPTRDEKIVVGVDAAGTIGGQMWSGGAWSTLPFSLASGVSSTNWGFAVAYESNSGDAMLVWNNGSTGTTGLSYRVWNGSIWSAEQTISAPAAGEPAQIRIASNPLRDEMLLVVCTADAVTDYALVWNGSSWGNGVVLDNTVGADRTDFAVAYEALSGEGLVVYEGDGGSNAVTYRSWNGTSWSAQQSLAAPAGVGAGSDHTWTALASDPNSDRIAVGVVADGGEIWLAIWDGSTWGAKLAASTTVASLTSLNVALAFEAKSGELLVTYGESGAANVKYVTWSEAGGWSAEQLGPNIGAVPNAMTLSADPAGNHLMLAVQDAQNDLHFIHWDGSAWRPDNELSTNTGETANQPFLFLYDHGVPPTLTLPGGALSYVENDSATVIDPNAIVTDADSANFAGGTLTVSFTAGGSAADRLEIRNQGTAAGQIGVVGANVSYGGVVIGSFSGGTDGATPLVISLNSRATPVAVQALARNITYGNVSDAPTSDVRIVRFVVSDGDGGTSLPATKTITVTPVNDAPVLSAIGNQSINEGATLTFTASTSDVDVPANTLTYSLSGAPAGASIHATTGVFSWTPTEAQGAGIYSFDVIVSDGNLTDSETITVTINEVNAAPSGADQTVTTLEDTAYTFTVADFGFADPGDTPANSLLAVRISTLPAAGSLTLNGTAVTAGQTISVANINAGLLRFTPAPDANGAGYASFTFQVQDDGGTANGGVDLDPSPNAITIDVTPVNDAPTATSLSAVETYTEDTPLNLTDIIVGDIDSANVTVTLTLSAPAAGSLNTATSGAVTSTYNAGSGVWSASGALADVNALLAGLTFTPSANYNASFTIATSVSDGVAAPLTGTKVVTGVAVNDAPVLAAIGNQTVTEGNLLTFTASASDADLPANVLTYSLSGAPAGAVIDAVTGVFSWTPTEGQGAGVYSFDVVVSDSAGGLDSEAITVTVHEVNSAPAGTDNAVTTLEDTAYTFTAADFGFADPSDVPANNLLAVTITTLPGAGSLTLNGVAVTAGQAISVADISAGLLVFAPAADANGAGYASFTFQVQDDGGTANGGVDLDATPNTITINVSPVNDAPVVSPVDLGTINEDGSLLVTQAMLLAGSSDIESNPLTAINLTLTAGSGTLTDNGDGTWTFTPDADWNGGAAFSFDVFDGTDSTPNTASLAVNPVNDAPVASDDSASGNEDTLVSGNVLTNDADIDGPGLTAALVSDPAHGSLTLNADGSFSYTPDADWHGTDSFTYTAGDGALDSNVATVTIVVNPVNDAPAATPVTLTLIAEDSGPRTITQAELLSNASDVDGPALTAINLSITSGSGTLADNGDGTWTYTPALNDNTSVTFSYVVTDGSLTATGSATLDITPVNDAPATSPVTLAPIAEDSGPRIITQAELLSNASDVDGPALTAINLSITSGSGTLADNGDGTWTYTPALNDNTSVTFSYVVTDGSLTDSGSAALDITPVNDAPTAGDASFAINEDNAYSGTLPAASDIDSALITYALDVDATHGNVLLSSAGSFSYSPDSNYFGSDSFTYTVSDGVGGSNTYTVTITVNPVNDAPTIVAPVDLGAINEDGSLIITQAMLLAGSSDIESNALTAINLTLTAGNGTLTDNGNDTWTFTPDADWNGAASFGFDITDGTDSTPNTADLVVNPVNDAPVVSPIDLGTINEDGSLLITQTLLLADASDVDLDSLTAINLTLIAGSGTLTDNGDGTWTFMPDADWSGAASFSFEIDDGTTTTANTASLTVDPVNDAPVITSNALNIAEGGTVVLSNADLGVADVEQSAAQLTFTISNVTHGQFEWAAIPGVAIASFSLADVDAGLVVFVHDASDLAPSYDVSVSDGIATTGPQTATITFTPVDEGINVTALSGTNTSESGGMVTFDVSLNSQPIADVTVFIVSGNLAEGSASLASLTFTSATWNITQQVTIEGQDDFIDDGGQNYAIQIDAASTDRNYHLLAAPDVALTNLDDDTAGVVMTPSTGLMTDESGASDTFSVVLASQPLANVVIGLSSSNTAEGMLSTGSLTFTPGNWNIPQIVSVIGVNDAPNDGDIAYQAIAAPASSADPNYNSLAAGAVDITNLDVAEPVVTDTQPIEPAPEPDPLTPPVDEAGAPQSPEDPSPPGTESALAPVLQGQLLDETGYATEFTRESQSDAAINAGLMSGAPLSVNNESVRHEVLTKPETQGGILLRLLEIIQADFILGEDDGNRISPAIHVKIVQDEQFKVDVLSQGAQIIAVSLSVGAVWWALRAGGLFASLLTSLPAWRSFDVLPVLSRDEDDDDASWNFGGNPEDDDKKDRSRMQGLTP